MPVDPMVVDAMAAADAAREGTAGAPVAVTGSSATDATDATDAACGCAVPAASRHAMAVDPAIKARNLARLRRIEGQVRGLQKMIDEDRYCPDILTQVSSVHEALRAVGRELMRNHLKHCATSAIRAGDGSAEAMYDELVDMMYKHSR